jgi:anti-anti-sigma factor
VPIDVEQNTQLNTIHLEGSIDITAAAELKTALAEAIDRGSTLHLSLENVTCLDVTAVQLLWAAGRAARAAGVPVQVNGKLPEPVVVDLAAAGFSGFPLS